MIVPIYTAWLTIISPNDTLSYEIEEASFHPIPSRSQAGPMESTWNYVGGEKPRHWIKTPPLATLRDDVLWLSGEKHSAKSAWVLLSTARRGDSRFTFVEAPKPANLSKPAEIIHEHIQAPPAAIIAPGRRQFPVYCVHDDLWMYHEPQDFYAGKLGWSVQVFTVDAPKDSEIRDGLYFGAEIQFVGQCAEMTVRNAAAKRFGLELASGSPLPPMSRALQAKLSKSVEPATPAQLPPPPPKRKRAAVAASREQQAAFSFGD